MFTHVVEPVAAARPAAMQAYRYSTQWQLGLKTLPKAAHKLRAFDWKKAGAFFLPLEIVFRTSAVHAHE